MRKPAAIGVATLGETKTGDQKQVFPEFKGWTGQGQGLWADFLFISRKQANLLALWAALAEKQALDEAQEESFLAELEGLLQEKERVILGINGRAGLSESSPKEILREAQALDGQIRGHLQALRRGMAARLSGMRRKWEVAGLYRLRVRQWGGVFVDSRK